MWKYFNIQCSQTAITAVLFEGSESSFVCILCKGSFKTDRSIEHRWNDPDRGKAKYSKENLSQRLSTTHTTWTDTGLNAGLRVEMSETNRLCQSTKSASRFSKEHCLLEGSRAPSICPSGKTNVSMKLCREHWWKYY